MTAWIGAQDIMFACPFLHYLLLTPQGVESFEELNFQLRSELGCLLNPNGDVICKRRVGGDDMGQAVAFSIGFNFCVVPIRMYVSSLGITGLEHPKRQLWTKYLVRSRASIESVPFVLCT